MVHYFLMWINLFGYCYKRVRFCIKIIIFTTRKIVFRPNDLEGVVKTGHVLLKLSKPTWPVIKLLTKPKKTHPQVEIYDLNFENPLTFAAYESNIDLLSFFLELGIGGGCYKTMMTDPREGNARPRLQEVMINNQPSLINALGLPGKGAKETIKDIISSSLLSYQRPLGLSVGGDNRDDYRQTFMTYERHINDIKYPFYYELNISCPNTESGQCLADNHDDLAQLLGELRAQTKRVISVKLSPDQADNEITELAGLICQYDRMMINAGNTTYRSCVELGLNNNAISRGGGGLSGPSLLPRTLELIRLLKAFNCPIMATGGIYSEASVRACLAEGASLVGMATALVMNPFIIPKILDV